MIAAIVLAAGKSERMGRPKALLRFGGLTFLEAILDAVKHSRAGQTVVVVGCHREAILSAVHIPQPVFNADYELGMITSIQAGIRTLVPDAEGALLFLVDHPITDHRIIDRLIESFVPGRIVIPTFQGRRGHPVLFSRDVLQEILALPLSSGANIVVRRDPSRVIEVPVDSKSVISDIDTPEDFDRFLQENN